MTDNYIVINTQQKEESFPYHVVEKSTYRDEDNFSSIGKFYNHRTAKNVCDLLNEKSEDTATPVLNQPFFIEKLQKITYGRLPSAEITNIADYILKILNENKV